MSKHWHSSLPNYQSIPKKREDLMSIEQLKTIVTNREVILFLKKRGHQVDKPFAAWKMISKNPDLQRELEEGIKYEKN